MLNIVQKLQNKLTEGTHCKLYIEDSDTLGFINTLHANAAMLNVFMTENEAIEFVKNYTADEE